MVEHSLSPATPDEPWIEVTSSRLFAAFATEQQVSLAFTTSQTGKLFLLGRYPDGRLTVMDKSLLSLHFSLGNWRAQHPGDEPALLLLYRAVRSMVEGPAPRHPVWVLPGK